MLIIWSTEVLGNFSNAVLQQLEYLFFFFFPTASLTELIELNVFCGARAPLTPVTQDNQGVISLL